jgi:hypothetical protein
MSVEQIEKVFEMEDIAPEGTVISKDRVTRHFQKMKEYAHLIVVSCSEFKLHWDDKTISCRFGVKNKYVEDTVPKEQFLDLMTTNSNLVRDLELAQAKIEQLEDVSPFDECSTEQVMVCYKKLVEKEKADNPLVEINQDLDCTPVDEAQDSTDEAPYDDPKTRL